MEPFRPTYAEIDLSALGRNIAKMKKILKPGVKLMAIVKANAYGHGAIETAKAAEKSGVDYLGVAYLGEAVELRSAMIRSPILILSETPAAFVDRLIDADITQTVYTLELAQALSDNARRKNRLAKVHIKIDTGMGRVGISADKALPLIEKILKLPNIRVEGIFTHYAKAEAEHEDFTLRQFVKFRDLTDLIEREGINIPIKHVCNSAATLNYPEMQMDMARIGICMYGLFPNGQKKKDIELEPVLSFKTKVLYLKKVPAGTSLSYGATYVTPKETTIATLPVGYADGLSRKLSNNGSVIIRGKKYPIVGSVTMDMTLVDVDDDNIEVWDDVTLIGSDGAGSITADDIAEQIDTINYEVICGIGKRVPRIYIK